MPRLISQLATALDNVERRRAKTIFVMMAASATFEALGVASVLPLLAIISNPDIFEQNQIMQELFLFLGYSDKRMFVLHTGVLFASVLLISVGLRAATSIYQTKFSLGLESSIGKRLVEKYLQKPYEELLVESKSAHGKVILSDVQNVIAYGYNPALIILSQSLALIAIISVLLIANLELTLSIILALAFVYLAIYFSGRTLLRQLGKKSLEANTTRYKAIDQILGAVREIKIGGLESSFGLTFARPAEAYADCQSKAQIISQAPRYILEAIILCTLAASLLYIESTDFVKTLPVIGLYIFAGYRLMPAFQQIYGASAKLSFVGASLEGLNSSFSGDRSNEKSFAVKSIPFRRDLILENVCYTYPLGSKKVLSGVTAKIRAGSFVGLTGRSGSGKSTLADIIISLLKPSRGHIEVDGEIINPSNAKNWQLNIGYVHQDVVILDDTVAANIVFGANDANIDWNCLKHVASITSIDELLEEKFTRGYATRIGDGDVRVSGGQRQRIAIARALYRLPKLLIFDEATSALDNVSEASILRTIKEKLPGTTVICITHKMNLLREAELIIHINEAGQASTGTFDKLNKECDSFRSLCVSDS